MQLWSVKSAKCWGFYSSQTVVFMASLCLYHAPSTGVDPGVTGDTGSQKYGIEQTLIPMSPKQSFYLLCALCTWWLPFHPNVTVPVIIIIIIIIITTTIFIVLSSWLRSLREFTRFIHLVNVKQRQAAADPQIKPPDLRCESACFRQLSSATTIAIYYYYSARKLILT